MVSVKSVGMKEHSLFELDLFQCWATPLRGLANLQRLRRLVFASRSPTTRFKRQALLDTGERDSLIGLSALHEAFLLSELSQLYSSQV